VEPWIIILAIRNFREVGLATCKSLYTVISASKKLPQAIFAGKHLPQLATMEAAQEELTRCFPTTLLLCPSCPSKPHGIRSEVIFERFPWCLQLACPVCGTDWYVCSSCQQSRVHMTEIEQVRRHYYRYHHSHHSNEPRPDRKRRTKYNRMEPIGQRRDEQHSRTTEDPVSTTLANTDLMIDLVRRELDRRMMVEQEQPIRQSHDDASDGKTTKKWLTVMRVSTASH
jgi:hypothetical protein